MYKISPIFIEEKQNTLVIRNSFVFYARGELKNNYDLTD